MEEKKVVQIGRTETDFFVCMENLQETQEIPSINPINLNYFGSEECTPGYSFGPFVRTSYVLHMISSGRGVLLKGGKSYPIGPGQAFLIYPGEKTVYRADEKDPWSYMWIGFHGFRAEEMVARIGFTPEEPVITCRNMDQICETMNRLLEFKELNYVNELHRMSALYHLIGLLTDNKEEPVDTRAVDADVQYVRTAVNMLINSVGKQIRVADVAKTIGISRSYLTSIFKREMKVSPQKFLMDFRMEKAASLLRSTDSPIGVVAAEVGYSDPLTFSKVFRKQFGINPSEYRRQKPQLVTYKKAREFKSENYL